MTNLILSEEVYQLYIQDLVPRARRTVWIGTADIKDMHTQIRGKFRPFLQILDGLCQRGVDIRLLHAREPGPRFRTDFDRLPNLRLSVHFERILCPRVHFKCIIIDGMRAYIGSANLTGAGMGPRGKSKRNFEAGIDTDDPKILRAMIEQYDSVFMGFACESCAMRKDCPDPAILQNHD